MPDVIITLQPDKTLGTISPRLYGHFAEHLGRCCYDGLSGRQPRIHPFQTYGGFRNDVVEALAPCLCPAALARRLLRRSLSLEAMASGARTTQLRLGMSCGSAGADDNTLGTHDLSRFADARGRTISGRKYGQRLAQELCDWVEYCNSAVPTTLAQLRVWNGSPEPFGVKWWGVGNENWGCRQANSALLFTRINASFRLTSGRDPRRLWPGGQ